MMRLIFEAFKEKYKKSYHPPAQIPCGFKPCICLDNQKNLKKSVDIIPGSVVILFHRQRPADDDLSGKSDHQIGTDNITDLRHITGN